jgi:Flp pilus assembly secretin CpaC
MRTRALAIAWLVLGLSTWAQAEEGARGSSAARPALALAPALAQASAAVRYAEPQSESTPQEHLEKAAVHLETAGWGALADHVRSLTSLRHKKAHAGGAAEAPRQVVVSVKVFEVEPSKLKNLGVDLPKTGFSVERASGGPFATIDGRKVSLGDALDSLRKDGMAQVLVPTESRFSR